MLCVIAKIGFMGAPMGSLVQDGQYLWSNIITGIQQHIGISPIFLTVLMIVMTFGQALYLNGIFTKYDLLPSMSYLPAMTYVLLTSLLPEWSQVSLFLVLNWLLLAILDKTIKLYLSQDSRKDLINIGLLAAVVVLFHTNLALLVLGTVISLLVLRPFRLADFVALIIGLLVPLYFLAAYWYLVDELHQFKNIFQLQLGWPLTIVNKPLTFTSLGVAFLFMLLGFAYLSVYLNRIVVQTKKYWSVALICFWMLTFAAISNITENFACLLIVLPLLALIITPIWFESNKKWLTIVYTLLMIIPLIYVQYIA